MKKTIVFLVSLFLIINSMAAYASDSSSGEKLKSYGFISGDENGNLNENDPLTRAQLMVLIAQLNGKMEEAKNYTKAGRFSDVNYSKDWYAPYVSYAEAMGWTVGYPDGSFKPLGVVTAKELATVIYKVLGYPVKDLVFETIDKDMAKKGVPVTSSNLNAMKRGEAFTALWTTVNAKVNGTDSSLGVKLGKLKEKEDTSSSADSDKILKNALIKSVASIGNNIVEITFEDSINMTNAKASLNYKILEKKSGTSVPISDVFVIDENHVQLKTESLTNKAAYTLSIADKNKGFFGISKLSAKPKIRSIESIDTNLLRITFDRVMDHSTVTDPENYIFGNTVTAANVNMEAGGRSVLVSTENLIKKINYKVTIKGVLSTDGVEIVGTTKVFSGKPDLNPPTFKSVDPITNSVIHAYFSDTHGIDKETVENISSWAINGGAEIRNVEVLKSDGSSYYDMAILQTSELKSNKKYTISITGLTDGSTSKNTSSKKLSRTFYAKRKDLSAPTLSSNVEALSGNEILLFFKDASALDQDTLLDSTNYKLSGDLKVRDVSMFDSKADKYSAEGRMVIIETTKQKYGKSYSLTVNYISDEFGNEMKKDTVVKWIALAADSEELKIESITSRDQETLELIFNNPVTKKSAEIITNYTISDLGSPYEATWNAAAPNVVTLKMSGMNADSSYTATVNEVDDYYGNTIVNKTMSFRVPSNATANQSLKAINAYIANDSEIRIYFDSDVSLEDGTIMYLSLAESDASSIDATAEFIGKLENEFIFKLSSPSEFPSENKAYTIIDINYKGNTIKNIYGNSLEKDSLSELLLMTTINQAEAPEIIGAEQVDASSIEVEFSEPMMLDSSDITFSANGITFSSIEVDPENSTIVTFESDSVITGNDEIVLNLSELDELTSIAGINVSDSEVPVNTDTFDSLAQNIAD